MKPPVIPPAVMLAVDYYTAQSHALNDQTTNQSLAAYRAQAQVELAKHILPIPTDEDWKYTRLDGFLKHHFYNQEPRLVSAEDVAAFLPNFDVHKLVFIDGHFSKDLSDDASALPAKASMTSFADLSLKEEGVSHLFSQEDELAKAPFAVLNGCLVSDGFTFNLGDNGLMEQPLFVLHIQTNPEQSIQVRHRVSVGQNAEMTLVERYVSLSSVQEAASFTNVVTQIDVAKHARFKQVIMQELNDSAYYFNNQYIYQDQESHFNTFFGSVGACISRHQNHLWMNGEHVESEQNSACMARDHQIIDSRTDTQHTDVWGESQQNHKYVLTDSAVGIFNGMIRVDQKAQKTDGQMDNSNLVLSDTAKMNTKPQLEIYADDVKCSHGSATGQIDEKQVFYMQARGIKRTDAIKIITHAFLLEPAESIRNDEIRHWVLARLSAGLERIEG